MFAGLKENISIKKIFLSLLFAGLAIIVLTFLFDFLIMPYYTKHGKEYELPDVTTRQLSPATEVLKSAGFRPIVQDSSYDDFFETGIVLQQNPLPFSRVKKGRRVYLSVSLGEKPIRMPSLVGMTPQDAGFKIRERGLKLNEKFYEFSNSYYKGVVIAQSVMPKTNVHKNQTVDITISLGQAPTSIELPNVVGKSLISAQKDFEALGVKLGLVRYSYRPKLVPGTVLHQSVKAGYKVAKIDSVNLLISTDEIEQTKTQPDSNDIQN